MTASRSLTRRWDPWSDFWSLQEEVNRLFESFPTRGIRQGLLGTSYLPPVDVLKDKDAITVKVDLPGMKKEDLEITVLNENLCVRGTKKLDAEVDERNIHTRERFFGSFERVIGLPDPVDPERITARFVDGVLTVVCPLRESAKPRQIAVDVK